MQTDNILITPEVASDSKILYLIRIDGEETAFVDTEEEAILVVDSLAADEQKKLESDNVKVYREDLNKGKKVVLSTQEMGLFFNGSIQVAQVIDFVAVCHAILIKNRLDVSSKIPTPPPAPPVEQVVNFPDIQDDEESYFSSSEE